MMRICFTDQNVKPQPRFKKAKHLHTQNNTRLVDRTTGLIRLKTEIKLADILDYNERLSDAR